MRLVGTLRTFARLHGYTALRAAAVIVPVVALAVAAASGGHIQPDLNKWG